ncbi:uncharacterized protein LOC121741718 [Salvia splendens]|uniref:uncharacterized protein LOC121741718 n=1 Tax=Salvia splendens TaxID=180675 RepID=UPI001C27B5F2|nr:uncharacterized protein LOC121741718 [Salvia splendens]
MSSQAPVAIDGGGMNLLANNWLQRFGGGGEFSSRSAGSELDLAVMVSDFFEIGSAVADSWCSCDSDSGLSDLAYLTDRISFYNRSVDQYERDLMMVIKSSILSISETWQVEKPDPCNASCILYSLVKLLQSSGYDAALCATKWQGDGKVPGGEHEFVDVIAQDNNGGTERYIIDIDFRSHFQIARAVKSYNAVLSSLPAIYVGTVPNLKQLLQIMVEASRYSLEQNSMPLPPWRALPYLEAKWESPCERIVSSPPHSHTAPSSLSHLHCIALLQRLKSFVRSDIERNGI